MPGIFLSPGPNEIAIYGDGSFSCDLLVGAWATHVPSFGLQITGSGFGTLEGHFEFCALVEGIQTVVRLDHTDRPLHLHTDSEYALTALQCLSARTDLPARKSFESIRELYVRITQLIGTRRVRWSRANTNGEFHRICHQAARCALRKQIKSQLAVDAVMALSYEERRREVWLGNRQQLVRRMRRVENNLQVCEDRIAQLSQMVRSQ